MSDAAQTGDAARPATEPRPAACRWTPPCAPSWPTSCCRGWGSRRSGSGRRWPGCTSSSLRARPSCWPAATSCRPASTPGTVSTGRPPATRSTATRSSSPRSATCCPRSSRASPSPAWTGRSPRWRARSSWCPATVPRYALNAANARWGSLFDALYGTDALPLDHELARGYDERRGAQVIAEADRLLDALLPARRAPPTPTSPPTASTAARWPRRPRTGPSRLADPGQLVGYRGDPGAPEAVLLRRHGLHVELTVDAGHRVGRGHHAHVADVVLESAVTTIVDLEDSVATVDGPDKVGGYRSWLGLMTGELEATFPKGGETVTRTVNGDRTYTGVDGSELVLPGRSLLLVRNVGHHMRLDAVRTAGGEPLLEECLDILVSTIAARARPPRARPLLQLPHRQPLRRQAEDARAGRGRACRSTCSPPWSRRWSCPPPRSRSGSWTRSGGRRSTWKRASPAPPSG